VVARSEACNTRIGIATRLALVLATVFLVVSRPASAKTTVTVEGTTVVIHVPIEVVGMSAKATVTLPEDIEIGGVKMAAGTKANGAAYLQQGAMNAWNKALAGFKWADCLTFRLDLQIIPIADRKAAHQPGRHRVEFDWEDPPDWLPADMRESWMVNGWYSTGPDDIHPDRDYSFPFTGDVYGHWFRPSAATIGHEVGHVLGLGDDYFRHGNPDGTSSVGGRKPTGEMIENADTPVVRPSADDIADAKAEGGTAESWFGGTFTTSGVGMPDPAAVARVIEQMKAAGILPQCWKGTLQGDAVFVVDKQRCTDSWKVDMTVITRKEGEASGEATARRTAGLKCTYQYPVNLVQAVTYRIEGQRQSSALQLRFTTKAYEPSGSIDVVGFTALLQGIGTPTMVALPIVANTEAKGRVSLQSVIGPNVRNASGDAFLKCTTC
jgi:hypothetical protein